MSRKGKAWAVLFAVLLIACAAAWYGFARGSRGTGVAGVYQDGVLLRTIELSAVTAPYEFTVTGQEGTNTVRVDETGVFIREADCPDQTCVRHGPLLEDGTPIVCLPNRLVIRWVTEEDAGLDGQTGG